MSDSANNELFIINLATVPGRRNSKIPPAQSRDPSNCLKTIHTLCITIMHTRKENVLDLGMQYIEGKSRKQCVLFPQALDEIIDENNDVRFIDLFAENIDISSFSFTNCDNKS